MNSEDVVRLFSMSHQLIERDLARIETELGISLGRASPSVDAEDKDDSYYPQFEKAIRDEAARMSRHYEVFYTLERTIRAFVADALEDAEGPAWWVGQRVLPALQTEVAKRIQKEVESGFTRRSEDPIDYTTFGELGEIIKNNWDVFGAMLNSPKAVERIMANLNTLRGPIAHFTELAEDEVVRLRLSVRDWFRQLAAARTAGAD